MVISSPSGWATPAMETILTLKSSPLGGSPFSSVLSSTIETDTVADVEPAGIVTAWALSGV